MSWIAVGMGTISAVSTYAGIEEGNAQADASKAEAERRYAIQTSVANAQLEDLKTDAMTKMTDVSRKFLMAKGQRTAIQAETGVSGNVAKRIQQTTRMKAGEAKGKIAREIDTSAVNVANDMLGKQIDTQTAMAKAEASKTTGLDAMFKVASSAATGAMAGSQFAGTGAGKSLVSGTKDLFNQASIMSGVEYNTNFLSEQSIMLAQQEW